MIATVSNRGLMRFMLYGGVLACHLPVCAPSHNPTEYDDDLKQKPRRPTAARLEDELIERTWSVLRAIQRFPDRIGDYSRPGPVRYAA